MRDRKLDLDVVEDGAQDQQHEADEIRRDAEQHRERVDRLNDAMSDLRAQQNSFASAGLEMALVEAERARQESEKKMDEARERRDALLAENRRMSEAVARAYDQRKQSTQKLAIIRHGAEGSVAGQLQAAADALEIDLNRLGFADAVLQQARAKLEAIQL